MALNDVTGTVTTVVGGLVSVLKALVVFFIFAGILFTLPSGVAPVDGIMSLVGAFMDNGLVGLLALLVFMSFLK